MLVFRSSQCTCPKWSPGRRAKSPARTTVCRSVLETLEARALFAAVGPMPAANVAADHLLLLPAVDVANDHGLLLPAVDVGADHELLLPAVDLATDRVLLLPAVDIAADPGLLLPTVDVATDRVLLLPAVDVALNPELPQPPVGVGTNPVTSVATTSAAETYQVVGANIAFNLTSIGGGSFFS